MTTTTKWTVFVLWFQRNDKCCHLNFNVSSWIIGGKKNVLFAIHLVCYLAVFSRHATLLHIRGERCVTTLKAAVYQTTIHLDCTALFRLNARSVESSMPSYPVFPVFLVWLKFYAIFASLDRKGSYIAGHSKKYKALCRYFGETGLC